MQLRSSIDALGQRIWVRRGKLGPGRERIGGTESKRATEIHRAQAGVEELRDKLGGYLMRRGEERCASVSGDDVVDRKRAQRCLTNSPKLREQFSKAVFPLRAAYIKGRRLHRGMAHEDARQLETGIASDTDNRDFLRISHFACERAAGRLTRSSIF